MRRWSVILVLLAACEAPPAWPPAARPREVAPEVVFVRPAADRDAQPAGGPTAPQDGTAGNPFATIAGSDPMLE